MSASEARALPESPEPRRPVLRWMPARIRRNLPWLVLILCSITFAEFLTGSTPVVVPLINPLSAAFLVGLYGGGVLLVREAAVRWGKGWPTVLLLGAAYGIAEEGIGTKTFFGPAGVGYLATYGHVAGVNWVWAVELSLFHSIYSIGLPIAVVGLAFPATAGRPFLPTVRARAFVLAVYVATVSAMFVLFNRSETPSIPLLLAAVAAAAGLVLAGRFAPRDLRALGVGRASRGPQVPPFGFGVLFVFGFFGLAWVAPHLVSAPIVVAVGLVVWPIAFGVHVARHRETYRAPRSQLDLTLGCLSLLMLLAVALGVSGDYGALPVVAAVVVVAWRLRTRLAGAAPPSAALGAVGDGSAS